MVLLNITLLNKGKLQRFLGFITEEQKRGEDARELPAVHKLKRDKRFMNLVNEKRFRLVN
ncbi:hypothetical protein SAMN05216352_10731 [Alteribacillus bidgolensis]|uniref:Uncharacterized protein n=1 Tax=Alteribacillus bidgolensis TaxID=930129 RepID=A0A1G8K234_9BACI|nr:hypothetical protein SAMN05216352_10731 [Alteribacillus bidgolensis]